MKCSEYEMFVINPETLTNADLIHLPKSSLSSSHDTSADVVHESNGCEKAKTAEVVAKET